MAAVLIVTVAVALAACGGSDEKRLTKEQYIEQADAICARSDTEIKAKLEAAVEGLPSEPNEWTAADKEAFAKAVRTEAVPRGEQQYKEIKALKPPAADQETIDEMLAEVKASNEKIGKLASGDGSALVDAIVSGEDPSAKANELAQDYGLQECGSNS